MEWIVVVVVVIAILLVLLFVILSLLLPAQYDSSTATTLHSSSPSLPPATAALITNRNRSHSLRDNIDLWHIHLRTPPHPTSPCVDHLGNPSLVFRNRRLDPIPQTWIPNASSPFTPTTDRHSMCLLRSLK